MTYNGWVYVKYLTTNFSLFVLENLNKIHYEN
jgi:hypothetical protein